MATDTENALGYYLRIDVQHKDALGSFRLWSNLKVAFDGKEIWVKGFDYQEITSFEVKSIPYKTIFDEHDGKLHLHGSLLPERNIPSLLWTDIARALPVEIPSLNHNFFGIKDEISMQLMPSEKEEEAVAMITTLDVLKAYIETAPAIRLLNLEWVVIDDKKVFLLGTPFLPLIGNVFWQEGNFMMPTGYDFRLSILKGELSKLLNPTNENLIIWNEDSSYFEINKTDLQPLTLSSFRLTTNKGL